MTETTKKILNMHYGMTAEQLRAQHAARMGSDGWRDTRITRRKSPEELAERDRNAELERQKAAEQAAQEQAAADLQSYHDSKQADWLAAGGTEKSFRDAWPAIEQRYLMGKIGLGE